MRAALIGLWLGSLSACSAGPDTPAPPLDLPALIARQGMRSCVEIDGRVLPAWDSGRPPRLLWASAPAAESWQIERGEEQYSVSAEVQTTAAGVRLHFPLSGAAPNARVRLRAGAFSQEFFYGVDPDELPAFEAVRQLRAAKDLPAARAELARLEGDTTLSDWARLWLPVERARVAQLGGDSQISAGAWEQAAAQAERSGPYGEISRRLRAAAWHRYRARQFREAEELLDRAEGIDRRCEDSLGLLRIDYYRGLIAQRLGDLSAATTRFEQALKMAEQLGERRDRRNIVRSLGPLLQDQGRHAEARARLESLPEDREDAIHFNNLGWVLLRGVQAGAFPKSALARARGHFEAARRAAEAQGDTQRVRLAEVHLAATEFAAGALTEARHRLEGLGASEGFERVFVALQLGEIALTEQRGKPALSHFDAALALAVDEAAGRETEPIWRARWGRARAFEAMGETPAAIAAWERALQGVDAVGRRTALRESRSHFYGDRQGLFAGLIALRLRRGEVAEAFAVADAARTAVLRSLEASTRLQRLGADERRRLSVLLGAYLSQRDAWERSRNMGELLAGPDLEAFRQKRQRMEAALRAAFDRVYAWLDEVAPESTPAALRAGELSDLLQRDEALLSLAHLGDRRLLFWLQGGALEHHFVAAGALAPWVEARLKEAPTIRRLYVVDAGDAEARELASAPDAAEVPLGERLSVLYLPHAGLLRTRPGAKTQGVTVLGDPAGDLPAARAEARAVAQKQPGSALIVGEAVTRAAMAGALESRAVVHFAGHGVLRPERPFDAHLRLAGDQRFTLEEILARPVGSRLVVLSGCETGGRAALAADAGIGLPDALLFSGAEIVLATEAELDDVAGQRFMQAFYAAGGADDPEAALRRTIRASRQAGEQSWRLFRLAGVPSSARRRERLPARPSKDTP